MQANELAEASDLALKWQIPALVVHPDIISDAVAVRGVRQGQYKIITPVDWPKGDNYAMTKVQGMGLHALETDGFEILLSDKPHRNDIKKEIRTLTEFIKTHLSPLAEIRIILGTLTRPEEIITTMVDVLKECPSPALVRNDHHTKAQQSKANTKVHQATIDLIQEHASCSIKISGNVSLKTIASCQSASRFGVNLKQAQNIIKEARQNPDKLNELMSAGISEVE
jgi:hypothetical protein